MEIERKTSSNGTTYRIISWSCCYHTFYEIEFLKYAEVETDWWDLANGFIYNSLQEAKEIFNGLTK